MVSSELPEVIGMSDRIIVMHDGLASRELPARSDEATILSAATGTLAPAIGAADAAEGGVR
jgi:ribose transport system ATP-binding protein